MTPRFFALNFKFLTYEDEFYCSSFFDHDGQQHFIMGKRCDWLYITDQDRIVTLYKLRIITSSFSIPVKTYIQKHNEYVDFYDKRKLQVEHLKRYRNDVSMLFVRTDWDNKLQNNS